MFAALAIPLLMGCVATTQTVPRMVPPATFIAPLQPGFYTTFPTFCPYEEVALVDIEGWSLEDVNAKIAEAMKVGHADAIVEYKPRRDRSEWPGLAMCKKLKITCDESGFADVFGATGLLVRWDCPDGVKPQNVPLTP